MANFNIAAGGNSGAIPTTPKTLVTVGTDKPVRIFARNNATTPAEWNPLGRLKSKDSKAFVAPSDAIRIENAGSALAHVEVL